MSRGFSFVLLRLCCCTPFVSRAEVGAREESRERHRNFPEAPAALTRFWHCTMRPLTEANSDSRSALHSSVASVVALRSGRGVCAHIWDLTVGVMYREFCAMCGTTVLLELFNYIVIIAYQVERKSRPMVGLALNVSHAPSFLLHESFLTLATCVLRPCGRPPKPRSDGGDGDAWLCYTFRLCSSNGKQDGTRECCIIFCLGSMFFRSEYLTRCAKTTTPCD